MLSSVACSTLGYVAAPHAVHAAQHRPQRMAAPTAQAAPRAAAFDVKDMAGVSFPLGFWDPLGFTSGASKGKVKFYREAEIKHWRVAMLASVGFLLGETFHPMWGGTDCPASLPACHLPRLTNPPTSPLTHHLTPNYPTTQPPNHPTTQNDPHTVSLTHAPSPSRRA